MTVQIDTQNSAAEEILATLEYGPPPEFKTKQEAINWVEENMPIGVYFEVHDKRGRVIYHGNNRMSE